MQQRRSMTHTPILPNDLATTARPRLAQRLSRLGDPIRLLSLFEQGLISGANFLSMMALARSFPTDQFGLYSFAYISMQFLLNLHRSIVVVPFVIHTAEPAVLAREGQLWRSLNLVVALISMAALGVAAAVAGPVFGAPHWMSMALLLAAVLTGPNYYYELFRRWAIQLGRYKRVVAAAAAYTIVSVAGFSIAVAEHSLPLAAATYVSANLTAAGVFLPVVLGTPSEPAGQSFSQFIRSLRQFLTWSLMANIAYNGYYYFPGLILGSLAGPIPVAAFQALRNITQPLSIIGTSVDNFDKPRAARALARDGFPGMRRQLWRTMRSMMTVGAPYILLVALFAKKGMSLIYADRYAGYEAVLYLWVLLWVVSVSTYPLETGLMLCRRPDLLFRSRLIAAGACLLLCAVAIPRWGVTGAMGALLMGQFLAMLFGYVYLEKATRSAK